MEPRALFVDGSLSATLEAQLEKARRAVDEIPERDFRSKDPSSLASELFARFGVRPISITDGAISVEAEEADIDRRRFRDIDHGLPGAAPTIRGSRVIYNVPFTGDAAIFRLKPSRWTTSVPRAVLDDDELRFVYEVRSTEVAGTRDSFDRDLAETKKWLGWCNEEVQKFNERLAGELERNVNQRVSRLSAASEGLAALGLPVREPEPARIQRGHEEATAVTSKDPNAGERKYDVALSFAGEDRAYVQEVAQCLAEAGANVFYDEFETVELWGKDLIEHLQDIYQNQANFCVMFVSVHYVAKPWPTHERRSAQARALVAKEEYLLPARFDDSTVPGLPPSIGYVDLRKLSPKEFADLVLSKIGVATPETE